MDAEDAKEAQLVEALVEHELVKAAAILDSDGRLERVRGHASVFRSGTPVDEDGDRQSSEEGHEDLYLETLEDHYLVVVFRAREEFDPIKEEVDRLTDALDL